MREIKFRGKEKDTPYGPLWRYGDLTHNFNAVLVAGHVVDDETVGQYTGLKNSTGKEIYERLHLKISLLSSDFTWTKRLQGKSLLTAHGGLASGTRSGGCLDIMS